MALPRVLRLRSSYHIDQVYKKGVFYKTPFFRIQYRKKNTPFANISFIVSKKIDTRAVIRNLLKRKVSAAFTHTKNTWQNKPYDIVVSIYASAQHASFDQLVGAITAWLQKIPSEQKK